MNTGASTFAQGVDLSLYIILGISLFFLLGITAVMIYFVIRYNKKRNPKATNIEGNYTLEVIWTVIPTLLVLLMFYYGWMGYKPMRNVPDNAMEINAYGQMWKFSFEYPDGLITDTLVVPINQAVKLNLISRDVIHSFYVPAFRIKEDMVPGKDNFLWFEATREGRFDVLCAEYCGMLHSFMLSSITVLQQTEYEDWLAHAPLAVDEHPGLTVMKQNACFTCHSQDGSKLIGPSFKGVFGRTQIVETNGEQREIIVDDEYIAKSIYEPNADIVQGYMRGLMISYENIISKEQVDDIIEYLKTLD